MSLRIDEIRRSFGGLVVLDGVTLSVAPGEIVGLIGPNGAGKSTLFSVATGFIRAEGGSIRLDGRDIGGLSPSRRARAGLVRTFQVPREFRHLTVRDNLLAAAPDQPGESLTGLFFRPGAAGRAEARAREACAETIAFLGLERVADQAAGGLSGGQKKLLELGRAMLARPRVVLLDEPFAGVNPVLVKTIIERVASLNRRGVSFLVIEHDLGAIAKLASRLYVMDRGTVLAEGSPAAVLAEKRVREAYLGGTS